MTYKQIEAMHEVRMWTVQIVIPVVIIGYAVWQNEAARTKIKATYYQLKDKLKRR